MLTQKQSNELNRANKLQIFLLLFLDIFKNFIPFKNIYDSFNTNYNTLQAEAKNKSKPAISNTDLKLQMKKALAVTLGLVLSTTLEYAKAFGTTVMQANVKYSESEIFKMKDGDILTFVQQLIKAVYTDALFLDTDFITFNITKAQIDTILLNAQAFNKKIGETDVIDSGSTIANANMDAAIALIHGNIVSMDNLVGNIGILNPDFEAGYYKNSMLEVLGTRHEGMEGTVYRNLVPVKGAVVKIDGTDKTAVTDANGHYSLIKVRPDTYTATATSDSGHTATNSVVVRHKHIDTVDFHLA